MKKNIIVTGGAGFLGANLCRYLLSNGHNVWCVDNFYTGRMTNIKDLLEKYNKAEGPVFRVIKADITNQLPGHMLPSVIHQIYNLACPASPPAYQGKHAINTTFTSVIGTANMLELAMSHGATMLQASTSEVYGDPEVHPQTEDYVGHVNPNGPRACYDEGKRCAESLCFDYQRIYGVDVKIVRIFNTYGPMMDPNDGRVVSNFVCQALRGDDITVYGDGSQTRSFCYVDDLIRGITMVMDNQKEIGPFNLGNPGEFTVLELAEKVIQMTNSKSKIVFKDLPVDDPKIRRPSIEKVGKATGWKPVITLEVGLVDTIKYFKEELSK